MMVGKSRQEWRVVRTFSEVTCGEHTLKPWPPDSATRGSHCALIAFHLCSKTYGSWDPGSPIKSKDIFDSFSCTLNADATWIMQRWCVPIILERRFTEHTLSLSWKEWTSPHLTGFWCDIKWKPLNNLPKFLDFLLLLFLKWKGSNLTFIQHFDHGKHMRFLSHSRKCTHQIIFS